MRKVAAFAMAVATAGAIVATPGTAHAASGTTYLFTSSGDYWQIWKTWESVGGGNYNGSWGTHSTGGSGIEFAALQKKINGTVSLASKWGSWTNKKTAVFRICNNGAYGVSGCSGWW